MLEVPSRPRARLNALSLYGLLGLCLATAVHVGTYVGATLDPNNPMVVGLEIAIFPLFFMFVYRVRVWQGVRTGLFGLKRSSLRWREMLPYFPNWVPPLFGVLFAYAIVNFLLTISHLPPNGTTAPLTVTQALYTVRAFSGHSLVFYALPTLFFLFVPADARPPEGRRRLPFDE